MNATSRLIILVMAAALLCAACEKPSEQGEATDEPATTTPAETTGQAEGDEAEPLATGDEDTGATPADEPPAEAIDAGQDSLGVAMRPLATCASVIYVEPDPREDLAGLPRFVQKNLCDATTTPLLTVVTPADAQPGEVALVDWTLLDDGGLLYILHDGQGFHPIAGSSDGGVASWPTIEPVEAEVAGGNATEHLAVLDGLQVQVYADASPLSPDDDLVQRYGKVEPTRTVAAPDASANLRATALRQPERCPGDNVTVEDPGGDTRPVRVVAANDSGGEAVLFDEPAFSGEWARAVAVEVWCEPALTFVRDQTEGKMQVTETVTVFDASNEPLHTWTDERLGTERMLPKVSAEGRYLVFDDAAHGWVYDLKGRKLVFETTDHEGSPRYGWHEDEGDDGVPDKMPLPAGPRFVFLPQAS